MTPQGFSCEELAQIKLKMDLYNIESHLIYLGNYLPNEYGQEQADLLIRAPMGSNRAPKSAR